MHHEKSVLFFKQPNQEKQCHLNASGNAILPLIFLTMHMMFQIKNIIEASKQTSGNTEEKIIQQS